MIAFVLCREARGSGIWEQCAAMLSKADRVQAGKCLDDTWLSVFIVSSC